MSGLRLAIAAGGTGGHVFPAVALAESVFDRHPDSRVLFIGSTRGLEERVTDSEGFESLLVDMPRITGSLLRLPIRLLKLVRATRQIIARLRSFAPHALVATGGYTSLAPALAARILGIPLVLLEQNAIPGRANRLLARIAAEVHVQFPESVSRFTPSARVICSGNPVRKRIIAAGMRRRQRRTDGPFTLLVMGGSLGARRINLALADALPRLAAAVGDMKVLHCSGERDEETARARLFSSGLAGRVWGFRDRMEDLYASADLVISRAGATSLAELSTCGIPSVLVPYPFATDRHQDANADHYRARGASEVVADRDLDGRSLTDTVLGVLSDPTRLAHMSAAMNNLARPRAGERIVMSIERLAGIAPAERPVRVLPRRTVRAA